MVNLLQPLTTREHIVYNHIMDGKSDAEIADSMCLSLSAVKTHTMNIYYKAGLYDDSARKRSALIVKHYKRALAEVSTMSAQTNLSTATSPSERLT